MKNIVITFLAIFGVLSFAESSFAQVSVVSGAKPATINPLNTEVLSVFDQSKDTKTISERKDYAQKYLEEMSFWTGTLLLRTQLATDRLSQNKIDVSEAVVFVQNARLEITKAQTSLNLFKSTIPNEQTEPILKNSFINTEKSLKEAQSQIAKSILTLQSVLNR